VGKVRSRKPDSHVGNMSHGGLSPILTNQGQNMGGAKAPTI
jgi:hypothetical protein